MKPFFLISLFGTILTAALLYLFPQENHIYYFLFLCTGSVVSMGFGGLAVVIRKHSYYYVTLILLIFIQIYALILITPSDTFETQADDEIRTAINAAIKYDQLTEALILQKVDPPFSRFTAAAHRFRDELPQHSWTIAFSNPSESYLQTYLLNIRNDIVGYAYPNITDVKFDDVSLTLWVSHDNALINYEIPIRDSFETLTIIGRDSTGNSVSDFTMKAYTHYLKPIPEMRFQALYWRLLDWIK